MGGNSYRLCCARASRITLLNLPRPPQTNISHAQCMDGLDCRAWAPSAYVGCRASKKVCTPDTGALTFWFCRSTAARAERTAVLAAFSLPRLRKAPLSSTSPSTCIPPPPPPSRCTPAFLPLPPFLPSASAAKPHRLRISLSCWERQDISTRTMRHADVLRQ